MTKIKEIRTKVYQWNGETVPPQNNFCTNASYLLFEKADAMGSYRFHEWLICEIETDDGIIGIGNAALAPQVAKKTIDTYCLLYTSPSPRDGLLSRMPSSA